MIGPLAKIISTSNSFKIVLIYFGKVWLKSNLCILLFYWLIYLFLFSPLPLNASFLIVKHSCVREELIDVVFFFRHNFKDHCAQTYFWWVCTRAPCLWSVHIPIWQFSLHLPLSVYIHSYQQATELQPHFHGRKFPTLSMLYQHRG